MREATAEARPAMEVIEAEDKGREGEVVGEEGHVEGGGAEEGAEPDNGEGADGFDEVTEDGVGGAPAVKAVGRALKKRGDGRRGEADVGGAETEGHGGWLGERKKGREGDDRRARR